MNNLQPLDIIDNRSLEQIRADGDDRWPDGRPYIKDGVCCVCGEAIAEPRHIWPNHVCRVHLDAPVPCEVHLLVQEPQKCTELAHWMLGSTAMCDECIMDMLEQLPDNRTWLAPALDEIAFRQNKVVLFTVEQDEVTGNPRARWLLPGEADAQWFHERSHLGPRSLEAAQQDVWMVMKDARYVSPEQFAAFLAMALEQEGRE